MATPVILIFDVGKTNKKLLLFDEQYNVVHEESVQLEETKDEDGFACEDIVALTEWIKKGFSELIKNAVFDIRAVNFSAYGASFVYISAQGKVMMPLYNYLKPYPAQLQKKFYETYGGENRFSKETASPVLGSLNSGMQLYRLKYEQPQLFQQIAFALHLPQYLSYILTDYPATDITSIGCHSSLWNFAEEKYHHWVYEEGIEKYFAPILPCTTYVPFEVDGEKFISGIGLHDSSAALIPYLSTFAEPFILLSTGTWCISLNPFNYSLLTDLELHQDCLCYLSYKGKPVKASRLFAGYEHEEQTKKLAAHFNKANNYFTTVTLNENILNTLKPVEDILTLRNTAMIGQSQFEQRDINSFASYEEAYHQLIRDIIAQQVRSTKLVLTENVKQIFVDGGFSKNEIYMHILAKSFPGIEVCAATVAQASALGAALAIHKHWNTKPIPENLIQVKKYS